MKHIAKYLKISLAVAGLVISTSTQAQSIQGKWQLVKSTTCMEDEMSMNNDSTGTDAMIDEMKSMSSPAAQIVTFKEKGNGEESTRILSRKKYANKENFLYKYNGEMLIIMDKKSQTITEVFKVDKLDQDSLILSNENRACDTKVFLKIKEPKSN
jgi:hypothetical protein